MDLKLKRIIPALILILTLSGCRTTFMVTNRSDPKDFTEMPFAGTSAELYEELVIDVPGEVSSEDFDIENTSLFAEVYVDSLWLGQDAEAQLSVSLYLGLESGEGNLDDSERNELLEELRITDVNEKYKLEFKDPRLVRKAIRQDKFYIKALISVEATALVAGTVKIDNVYFITHLSRETNGLLSFFYLL